MFIVSNEFDIYTSPILGITVRNAVSAYPKACSGVVDGISSASTGGVYFQAEQDFEGFQKPSVH
jgi:hypothetical protein